MARLDDRPGSAPRGARVVAGLALGLGLGLGLGSFACSWSQQRPAEQAVAAVPTAAGAKAAAVEPERPSVARATTSIDAGAPVEVSDTVAMQIQDVEGTTASRAGAILGTLTEPVGRCTPRQPGVLNVRVTSEGRHTAVQVAPGSSVDSDTRRCMVDALASLDVSQVMPDDSTPSTSPQRFASTVSISW
jgi:hypothetical protein